MSRPPLPSNKGKTRIIKDIDGNKRQFTVLDQVTQEQSTNHDAVRRLSCNYLQGDRKRMAYGR